jgi:hypothetical protein
MFIFTLNRTQYKENLNTLTSKMVIINELQVINLDKLSEILGGMGIDVLNIFSIYGSSLDTETTTIFSNKDSYVKYISINYDNFVELLNHDNCNFMEFNKHSLFIARGGNFLDIKNLFARIQNKEVNVGRGGSQKAHALSPLDFRLSTYLMAMFNFDYNLISSLNSFNFMSKDRYLSYMDKPRPIKFVSINLDKGFKNSME